MLEFPGISREHGISGGLMRWALVLVAMTSVALMVAAPPAPALEKGLIDYRLERSTDASQRAAIIHEIGPSLKTRWVRLLVDWAALEFERGTYSPTRWHNSTHSSTGFTRPASR